MWGWLPNIYYDFLARVVPGAAVVLGAVYLKDGPYRGIGFVLRDICSPDGSWLCRVGIGLLAAYLIGLLIGETGELIAGRLLERRDRETGAQTMHACFEEHNRTIGLSGGLPLDVMQSDLPDADLMRQQLSVRDSYASGRILALRAERRMCLVLVLGLFILALFNLLLYAADFVPKRLLIEALTVVSMLVLWRRSTRLHERVVRETCVAWMIHASEASS